jgi:membrane protein
VNLLQLLKATGKSWVDDHAMRLSAALAYYAVFSLAPLLIVAISIAGAIFGEDAARGAIQDQLAGSIGRESAEAVQEMIKGARNSGKNGLMAIVGFVVLLLTASGVFAQLKDAMNTVWGLEPKPGRAIVSILVDRFLSLTMVAAIGFLLLVSLILSAVVAAATGWLEHIIPIAPFVWHFASIGIDLSITTLLFAMIFKVLPDADIQWRDVWTGSFITACLFAVGKTLLALYLGRSETASTYGAAGALLLILSWVYYSSNILLFGAEFTQEFARSKGRTITPSSAAIRIAGSNKA